MSLNALRRGRKPRFRLGYCPSGLGRDPARRAPNARQKHIENSVSLDRCERETFRT